MAAIDLVAEDAVIAFHDANLVADAIRNVEQFFTYAGVKFATVFLPDYVCAIGLGGMADHITTELGPHAHDRDRFLVNAKHQVWGCVVAEALARGDVAPRQRLDASEEARATLQRELEEAHRAANNAVRAAGEEAKAREALRSQLRAISTSAVSSTAQTAAQVAGPNISHTTDPFSSIDQALRSAIPGNDPTALRDAAIAAIRAAVTGDPQQARATAPPRR